MHRKQLRLIIAVAFTITTLTVAAPASAHRTDSMVQGVVDKAVDSIDRDHEPSLVTASPYRRLPIGVQLSLRLDEVYRRNLFDGSKVTFTVVQTTALERKH